MGPLLAIAGVLELGVFCSGLHSQAGIPFASEQRHDPIGVSYCSSIYKILQYHDKCSLLVGEGMFVCRFPLQMGRGGVLFIR